MTDLRTGAELSQERFLLECAEQERCDLERAAAAVQRLIDKARQEGAEEMRERARRATIFCCFECSRVIAALSLTPEEP